MSIQNRAVLAYRLGLIAIVILVIASLFCLPRSAEAAPGDLVRGKGTGAGADGRVSVTARQSGLDVEAVFAVEDVRLAEANGYWAIDVPDCRTTGLGAGQPALPVRMVNVALPAGTRVVALEARSEEVLLGRDMVVYPAQPEIPVSTPMVAMPAFVGPDAATYAATTKVPTAVAELAGEYGMRGRRFAAVRIHPVRYVPAAREVYLATRVVVHLELAAGPVAAPAARENRRADFGGAAASIVVNEEMVAAPVAEEPVAAGAELATGLTDYLVITSETLVGAFQPLADHRAARNGFTTAVLSTATIGASYAGADTQAKIRACIIDYVNNRGTAYVVLGGDDTVVPDRNCRVEVGSTGDSAMPTDLYYAGLNSTWDEDGDGIYGEAGAAATAGAEGDLVADVYVGRIPVRTAAHATAYINKVIQFENNPIPNDRIMLAGAHIGINASPIYGPYVETNRPTDVVSDGHPDFTQHQLISDTEMWTRRLYRDSIQEYWQPTTLAYFFDTLTSWDVGTAGGYGLNGTNFANRLNQGWFHFFMMTHGNVDQWSLETSGFWTSSATAISGRLGILYTGACKTGAFDTAEPSLSEAFLRDTEGPVVYFGCSRDNWYSPDQPPASNYSTGGTAMDYAKRFYEQYYKAPFTSLGQVFYAHKAVTAGWSNYNGSDRWIQFGFNYQGDPALLAPAATRTLTTSVQGQGTVALNPAGGTYSHGATVLVTAAPAAAPWQFLRWEGDVTGSTNPTTLVMDADKTVVAVFRVPGDIDGDGYVDVTDLLTLAASWGKSTGEEGFDAACDFDGDGSVDVTDLLTLAENWGYGGEG